MNSDSSTIRDFFMIEPDIYTGGQPTKEHFHWLGNQKFEIVINLATAKSPDALPDEQQLVNDNDMAYVHIPVEWESPQKSDLLRFFDFFSSHHQFKTFVHCALNMRVSSFVFLYRTLRENTNPEVCLIDLLTIWKPNPTWQQFINSMVQDPEVCPLPAAWQVDWEHLVIQSDLTGE